MERIERYYSRNNITCYKFLVLLLLSFMLLLGLGSRTWCLCKIENQDDGGSWRGKDGLGGATFASIARTARDLDMIAKSYTINISWDISNRLRLST